MLTVCPRSLDQFYIVTSYKYRSRILWYILYQTYLTRFRKFLSLFKKKIQILSFSFSFSLLCRPIYSLHIRVYGGNCTLSLLLILHLSSHTSDPHQYICLGVDDSEKSSFHSYANRLQNRYRRGVLGYRSERWNISQFLTLEAVMLKEI